MSHRRRCPVVTPHASRLMRHASCVTPHASRLATTRAEHGLAVPPLERHAKPARALAAVERPGARRASPPARPPLAPTGARVGSPDQCAFWLAGADHLAGVLGPRPARRAQKRPSLPKTAPVHATGPDGLACLNKAHARARADAKRPLGSSVEGLVIRPLPDCQDRYITNRQIPCPLPVTATKLAKGRASAGVDVKPRGFGRPPSGRNLLCPRFLVNKQR